MAKILVEIVGDARKFKSELGNAGRDAENFGGKIKGHASGALKGLGIAAGGAALVGVGLLAKGLMDGVKTAVAHEKALAQTQAVIKSTGGAANVNSAHILKLSDSIEKMSGIDDLAIQSGENMLLTFKNIKNGAGDANKVFDQSTKILADMTVALGSDPQKQAIQLGKALNDPVKGISALSRVGVTFDADQKKLIKTYMEHGETAKAQGVILKELKSEFGGSAKAAGETMGGQLNILKAHLEDTEQIIGEKVLPVLNQLIQWAIMNWPTFQHYAEIALQAIETAWVQYGEPTYVAIRSAITVLVGWVRTNWDTISSIFAGAFDVIEGIVKLFIAVFKGDWSGAWNAIKQIVSGAFDVIVGLFKLAGPLLLAAAKAVGEKILEGIKNGVEGLLDAALSGVKAIPDGLAALAGLLLDAAKALAGKLWEGFKIEVSDIASKVAGFVNDIPGKLSDLAASFANAAKSLGSKIVDGLVDGVKSVAGDVIGFFSDLPGKITDALGDVSHLLYNAGASIITGLLNGMKSKISDVKNFASGIAGDIASLKGPIESDRALLIPHGQAIIEGLKEGLESRIGDIHVMASGIAPMISQNVSASPAPSAGGGGSNVMGGTTINVTVEGWVGNDQEIAEKIRNTLIRTGRKTTGGALGGFA